MEPASASDAELIDASRRGERAAFGELVGRCARMVNAVSYAATRDRALSEDIAQDTFVAAWRDLDRLRDAEALRPWLCGIARNLAHKARRRRGREIAGEDPDWVAGGRTPFDALRAAEVERVVQVALASVPDVYREALVLFYYEQQSARSVATALGVGEHVVHKRLSRGRRYLADSVEAMVVAELQRPRTRRDLAASVLAALPLPIALAVAPSRATAATKGTMWKLGALGVAAATVAVSTVAAWSQPTLSSPARASHEAALPAVASATARAAAMHAPPPPQLPASPVTAPPAPSASAAPPAAPHSLAYTCDDVAQHFVDLLVKRAGTQPSADLVKRLAARLAAQCRDDRWSERDRACVMAASDALDAQACPAPRPMAEPELAPVGMDARCEAVADHMLAVSAPDADDPRPVAQYATLRAQLVDHCTGEAWSETRRRCMLAARSGQRMVPCLYLDGSFVAPVTSGDADCSTVARHVAELMATDLGDAAAMLSAQPAALDPTGHDLADHFAAVCTEEHWSDAFRRCLAGSTNPTHVMVCRLKVR